MVLSSPPQALLFDVFGTCVNWRKSVTEALHSQAYDSLNSATACLASSVRTRASGMTLTHWAQFSQQWRDGYKRFTKSIAEDPSIPWISVDEHHLKSLKELTIEWGIEGLWLDEELRGLSLIWHRLEPWDDSTLGVIMLNRLFRTLGHNLSCAPLTAPETCTLSNGNKSLLSDLCAFSNISFTHLFSAEMFGTYKPAPRVYLGAAEKLGFLPHQCAMVAAHLNDLKAAKHCGLLTIYVERPSEEDWAAEDIEKARQEGWVDMWVSEGNKGFITVAEKLGIDVNDAVQVKKLTSSSPSGIA